MKVGVVLTCLLLAWPAASVPAQELCAQCLKGASRDRDTCLESAISREDKNSCEERHAAKAAACKQGECLLEQAAQSVTKPPAAPPQTAAEESRPLRDEQDQPRD